VRTSRRPIWYSARGLSRRRCSWSCTKACWQCSCSCERKAIPVVGVEVRLPDLIVLQHAVGVAGAAAEAAPARTLAPFGDKRVVAVDAFRDLTIVDVEELRERPQQLRTRQRGRRGQGTCGATPKNGLGTCWLSAAVPSAAYFGSSWLMFTGCRSSRRAAGGLRARRCKLKVMAIELGRLALQIDRILLHARCGPALVDVADRRADARKRAEGVAARGGQAGRERVRQRHGRRARGLRTDGVVGEPILSIVARCAAGYRIVPRDQYSRSPPRSRCSC